MDQNLGKNIIVDLVQVPIAAGQTDPDSSSVDMAGFESVMFIGTIGLQTATGVASIQAAGSANDSSFDDISGAVATGPANSDNKLLILDIVKPLDRYIRTTLTQTVDDTTWSGTIAIRYNGRKPPFTSNDLAVAMVTVIGGA
jgi:hypothetical protein